MIVNSKLQNEPVVLRLSLSEPGMEDRAADDAWNAADIRTERRIVAIVYDGFLLLDLSGLLGVLEIAGYTTGIHYRFELISVKPRLVRTSSGICVKAGVFRPGDDIDLLLVPGGPKARKVAEDRGFAELVSRAHCAAARTVSVGSGAFILGASGLLDGRRATTHMRDADDLAHRFPNIKMERSAIFTEDGNIWTSGGISSGIDLALALIERDHGFAIAQEVASGVLLYYRRTASQSQISVALQLQRSSQRFEPLLEWARQNLDGKLDIESLASRCGLSVRQFTRAFTASTGQSPGKAIEKLRLERATSEIAIGETSLELIARKSGFGNSVRMRRAFKRAYGHAPRLYRGCGL